MELRFEFFDKLVHHAPDDLGAQGIERDRGVEPVAEFRREHLADRFLVVALALGAGEAIRAAVELSSRYIHDRKLPDKAIDVIDESGAAQMLLPESRRKKTIGIKEIETTIATMARIPPKTVSKDDAEVLRHLELTLKQVVYGQDKAIDALSSSIKLARAGLIDHVDRLVRQLAVVDVT